MKREDIPEKLRLKIQEAQIRCRSACSLHAGIANQVSLMLDGLQHNRTDMLLAVLQYALLGLRAEGVDEPGVRVYTATTIHTAFSVEMDEEPEKELKLTPTYPAEPGELN